MTHDTVDTALVMAGWIGMAIIFAIRRRAPAAPVERRREPASLIGIALQGAGFALAWGMRRVPALFPVVRLR